MKIRTLLLFVSVPILLLTSCGGSSDSDSSGDDGDSELAEATELMNDAEVSDETGEAETVVEARDNVFKPKYVEVSKGTAITFVNDGETVHNVLPVQEDAFGSIEASDFDPGDEGTVTFDEVGDFPYYCSLHGTKTKGMIGGIRVVE